MARRDEGRQLSSLPHPALVCSGAQLDTVIAEMESGTFPLPEDAIWRGDLPRGTAIRLALATGATAGQVDEIIREER